MGHIKTKKLPKIEGRWRYEYELRPSMLGPPGEKTKKIAIACDEFDVWRLKHLCMSMSINLYIIKSALSTQLL